MAIPRFVTLDDLNLAEKRVLVREDFNVPIKDGAVDDDTRIKSALPTIYQLLNKGAAIMLMSHLGRPVEGKFDQDFSLAPVAKCLSGLLDRDITLIKNWQHGVDIGPGDIVMFENVRFETGEKSDDEELARHMAALCDVYINDAFATAHRAHASTHGVAKYAPLSVAGPLLLAEIENLSGVLTNPGRPMTAIVGGSKVSTKLTILKSLLEKVDQLVVGGGIANTFLRARGYEIGRSLCEPDLIDEANNLLSYADEHDKTIPLPTDVICGREFDEQTPAVTKSIADIDKDDLIMDVGPATMKSYTKIMKNAATIIWNGPLGVFEFEQFSNGTRLLANSIAKSDAFSIAGGGDTLSAIAKFNVADQISYVSTGGGAFLEFLEEKELPAITILEESARAWYAMERAREF